MIELDPSSDGEWTATCGRRPPRPDTRVGVLRYIGLACVVAAASHCGKPGTDASARSPALSSASGNTGSVIAGSAGDAATLDAGPRMSGAAAQGPRVVDLAIGDGTACVVLDDGRVGCFSLAAGTRRRDLAKLGTPWTDPSDPPLVATTVPGFPPASARAVAVGQMHSCVLLADHGVACWGSNGRGALGTGNGAEEGPPPQAVVGLPAVSFLTLAWASSYAIRQDGTVWAWGAGDDGVLGNGSDEDRSRPVRIDGLDGVAQIAASGRHACALTRAGDVLCWGANDVGQLGTASPGPVRRPIPVRGLHAVRAIGVGDQRSCALTGRGEIRCWGRVPYPTTESRHTAYHRPPDIPPNWQNPACQSGVLDWTPIPAPVPGIAGAIDLSSAADVDCVRDADGALCWTTGVNGPGPDNLPPTRLPVASVARVVAGLRIACTLDAAGTVTCFEIHGAHLGPAQLVHLDP